MVLPLSLLAALRDIDKVDLPLAVAHEEPSITVNFRRSNESDTLDLLQNFVRLLAIELANRLQLLVNLLLEKVLDIMVINLINIKPVVNLLRFITVTMLQPLHQNSHEMAVLTETNVVLLRFRDSNLIEALKHVVLDFH